MFGRFIAGAIAVVVVIAAFIGLIVGIEALSSYNSTQGGQVAVVRNGGPFDNHRIRQVIPPSSGRTYTGISSSVHIYPTQQRFYTISSDANQSDTGGVDVVQVPTADGIEVGMEGTLYFEFNTDCTPCGDPAKSYAVLRAFDTQFGTRTFTERGTNNAYHPYDGDNGIKAFEDRIMRPIVDNDLRQEIGQFRCEQLVSSCALILNPGNVAAAATKAAGNNNTANIQAVQSAIESSLKADIDSTLGQNYLTNVQFRLSRVILPGVVQDQINNALAAYGKVSQTNAEVAQQVAQAAGQAKIAKEQADAQVQKQRGYNACPACAQQDILAKLPQSLLVLGQGSGVNLNVQGK